MSNILNFDELTTPAPKVFRYKNEDHVAADVTLQQYLDRLKMTQNVTADSPIAEQMDVMIRILTDTFPMIAVNEWRNMSLAKLNVIMDFVMKPLDDIAEQVAQGQTQGNVEAAVEQPAA